MSFSVSFARAFGIALAVGLLLVSAPSHAKKACFGEKERLQVMADTGLKNAEGAPLVLSHKLTTHCFLVPYWQTDDGYVLGIKEDKNTYYPLPEPEKLKALQAEGLVPSPFPVWKRGIFDWLEGYLVWWCLLGFVVYRGFVKTRRPNRA